MLTYTINRKPLERYQNRTRSSENSTLPKITRIPGRLLQQDTNTQIDY